MNSNQSQKIFFTEAIKRTNRICPSIAIKVQLHDRRIYKRALLVAVRLPHSPTCTHAPPPLVPQLHLILLAVAFNNNSRKNEAHHG